MSTRVYLSKNTYQTTQEEEATPVRIRIQLSRATVKDLHSRLQHAYQRDDVRLDVHFISSLPVMQWSAYTAWVDRKPAQIVAVEG